MCIQKIFENHSRLMARISSCNKDALSGSNLLAGGTSDAKTSWRYCGTDTRPAMRPPCRILGGMNANCGSKMRGWLVPSPPTPACGEGRAAALAALRSLRRSDELESHDAERCYIQTIAR